MCTVGDYNPLRTGQSRTDINQIYHRMPLKCIINHISYIPTLVMKNYSSKGTPLEIAFDLSERLQGAKKIQLHSVQH